MDRVNRLQAIARACYYLGWIVTVLAIICRVYRPLEYWLEHTTRISGRNLMETSLLLFVICMASGVRAVAASASESPAKVRTQAA